MANNAKGMLVFPSACCRAASWWAHSTATGRCASAMRSTASYSLTSGSIGWRSRRAIACDCHHVHDTGRTEQIPQQRGWSAGANASVAVAKIGANGAVDTNTAKQSVVAFFLTNVGLMADLSLQGTKITKLDLSTAQA